jgi:Spy/CpxP family protein refolding chaperone
MPKRCPDRNVADGVDIVTRTIWSNVMKLAFLGVFAALALNLAVGVYATADDKKESPKGGEKLPAQWGKLGLSDDQKSKICAVQDEYKTQIDALEKQIKELRHKEKLAMEEVLTDGQKARLKEILLDKAGLGDKPGEKTDKPIKP